MDISGLTGSNVGLVSTCSASIVLSIKKHTTLTLDWVVFVSKNEHFEVLVLFLMITISRCSDCVNVYSVGHKQIEGSTYCLDFVTCNSVFCLDVLRHMLLQRKCFPIWECRSNVLLKFLQLRICINPSCLHCQLYMFPTLAHSNSGRFVSQFWMTGWNVHDLPNFTIAKLFFKYINSSFSFQCAFVVLPLLAVPKKSSF